MIILYVTIVKKFLYSNFVAIKMDNNIWFDIYSCRFIYTIMVNNG